MRTASARLLIMVLKIGPNRGPLPFRFGSHIWVGQPLNRPWTSRIDGQTDKPIDPPDFRRTERFKRFFFFFFCFLPLKRASFWPLNSSPPKRSLLRTTVISSDSNPMTSSARRWCRLHPDDVTTIRRWRHCHSLSTLVLQCRRPHDDAATIPTCHCHPTMTPSRRRP